MASCLGTEKMSLINDVQKRPKMKNVLFYDYDDGIIINKY